MVLKINGDSILFSLHVNSPTTAPTDKVSSLVGTLFNYLLSFNTKNLNLQAVDSKFFKPSA